jgi:tetratricopeptide (TPR) repeat protein
VLYRRLGLAIAVVAFAVLTSVAVAQPWRSEEKGNDAIALASKGDFTAARAATERASDIDPLSPDPYFDLSAVEDAAGDKAAAVKALENAVKLEPASPEAWRRLGEYYLNQMSDPFKALPVLKAALFLDPYSPQSSGDYLLALRAEQAKLDEAAQAADAKRAKRKASSTPAAPAPPTSP